MIYELETLENKKIYVPQVSKVEEKNHILYMEFETKVRTNFETCVFSCANAFEFQKCSDKVNTIAIPMNQINGYKTA